MKHWAERGEILKDKEKQVTLYLPPELKEKLQQEAANRGYTIKDLLVIILGGYFERASSQE